MRPTNNQMDFFVKLYWLGGVVSSAILALIITDGTFGFFQHGDWFGLAYNYYFLSLLNGHLDVPLRVINFEGHYLPDGTAHMYYGVGPALLRAFFHPFVDLQVTPVARPVIWFLVSTAGFVCQDSLLWMIRRTRLYGSALFGVVLACGVVAIWFSSPLIILAAGASIYHEPIAFGFLATMIVVNAGFRFAADRRAMRWLLVAALAAGLAVHARPHVAIGLYACVVSLFVWAAWTDIQIVSRQGGRLFDGRIWRHYALAPMVFILLAGAGLAYIGLAQLKFNGGYFPDGSHASYGVVYFGFEAADSERQIGFRTDGVFNIVRIIPNLAAHAIGGMELTVFLRALLGAAYVRLEGPIAGVVVLWLPWILLANGLNRFRGIDWRGD